MASRQPFRKTFHPTTRLCIAIPCRLLPQVLKIGEDNSINGARVPDLGELENSTEDGFHYVDSINLAELENSQLRLSQFEQDLKRARQQGIFHCIRIFKRAESFCGRKWPVAFDIDYARWLDEHQRLISDLRSAVNSYVSDCELQFLVDGVISHYNEIFWVKSSGAKSDIFHILFGMWKTPAERCSMWLGGFSRSEVLKILGNQIEPLTEQKLVGICNLQQSSQQAEYALSQGMAALQQLILDSFSSSSLGYCSSGNVTDYMGQMAAAMSKLATPANFLHQVDLLRLQTLQQLQRILSTRQAAPALVAINDYRSRLRALSCLWLARPKA